VEYLSLCIACAAFIFAAVAYWRSGGRADVEALRRTVEEEIQQMRAKQRELMAYATDATRAAYRDLKARVRRAEERLTQFATGIEAGLRRQITRAIQEAEQLERALADALQTAEEAAAEAAHETQEALTRRVRRLEARIELLTAKAKAQRALKLASENDFLDAEEQLHEAVALIKEARTKLSDDSSHDNQFETTARSLRQAIEAVKTRAADFRARVEKVVSDSDTLLGAIEPTARPTPAPTA
jgi:chromosome segregation ATPase